MQPMKKLLAASLLSATVVSGGCANGMEHSSGSAISATGVLVLKGSMPRFRTVLIQDGVERWELLRVPPDTALALQNKRVFVEGTVERPVRNGMLAPAVVVTRIDPSPN